MPGRQDRRVRRMAALALAACALALAAVALRAPATAESAPAGTITMNPPNASLTVGDTVSLTFDVSGGVDIHRVALGLQYNTSVLQAVDADLGAGGTQILPGPFPGSDTEGAVTQNNVSAGIVNYQYELDGSSEISGSGTVATVQFVAVADGNANLTFTLRQFSDGNDVNYTPNASPAVVVVGGTAPPVGTPTHTATPFPSITASPTNTPAAASATATSAVSNTPTRTPTATSAAATATATPPRTNTPQATSTARITILRDSNATPSAGAAAGARASTNGPNPAQLEQADGLPSAGNDDQPIQWWRWTFFGGALMLAFAGWFFTFAVHVGDKDPVLMDRFDASRQKYRRRR